MEDLKKLVVAGNTTMLYLLVGRNPECLSHAPFEADHLFDVKDTLFGIPTYYPPCMNAFVGADITCAVVASGMCKQQDTALLCDIGTKRRNRPVESGQTLCNLHRRRPCL